VQVVIVRGKDCTAAGLASVFHLDAMMHIFWIGASKFMDGWMGKRVMYKIRSV